VDAHIRISSLCKHVDDTTSDTNLNHYTYINNIKNEKFRATQMDMIGIAYIVQFEFRTVWL
jgi:hypothetical protein